MSNKLTFKTKDADGNEIELAVIKPNHKVNREAQKMVNVAMNEALQSYAPLRGKADLILTEQGLWTHTKEEQLKKHQANLVEMEKKLAGGIKLSEAKKIALDMRRERIKLYSILADKFELDIYTAEGQAETVRQDFLVSKCTVYNDSGDPYFEDLDDYLARKSEQDAIDAAVNFANLTRDNTNLFADMPENLFLKAQGFINDDLMLIDSEGRLINEDGKFINKDGQLINEDGKLIDDDGNLLDDKGNIIFGQRPFLDE
jgi:hypothetical protein